jgi:hypothetical protein
MNKEDQALLEHLKAKYSSQGQVRDPASPALCA